MPLNLKNLFFKLLSPLINYMGFLKNIFNRKKNVEEIKTSLDLLPTLIQKNFDAEIKYTELESAKLISEIKYSYEKSKKILLNIQEKEIEETQNNRFNKAALTSKKQIEIQLLKTLEKINPENIDSNINQIRAYSSKSHIIILNEINSFRKNIAYTSVYLKEEMKLLGNTLQEIINNLEKLNKLFNEKKHLFEFEKTKNLINEINDQKKEIDLMKKNNITYQKQTNEKNIFVKKLEEEIQENLKNEEYQIYIKLEKEKSEIAEEKQHLKTEISSMLSTIEKPLQRFNGLVKSGRWKISKDQEDLLNGFINNPLIAIKKDVSGTKFKEILGEVKKAIEDEKIELKEKEREKRLDALQELIAFDFFEKVFWKLNVIQKRQNEIESELKNNTYLIKINDLQKQISELIKENEIILDLQNTNKIKIEKILENITIQTKKVVENSEKIINKKIILAE